MAISGHLPMPISTRLPHSRVTGKQRWRMCPPALETRLASQSPLGEHSHVPGHFFEPWSLAWERLLYRHGNVRSQCNECYIPEKKIISICELTSNLPRCEVYKYNTQRRTTRVWAESTQSIHNNCNVILHSSVLINIQWDSRIIHHHIRIVLAGRKSNIVEYKLRKAVSSTLVFHSLSRCYYCCLICIT